jgi:hypothetical protein
MGQTTTKKNVRTGTVNHRSWIYFLKSISRTDDGERLINGFKISPTHKRTLFRWEREGASPVWWKVDAFLCSYEMIFTDFEIWCFVENMPLWEKNPPEHWD